MYPTGAGKWRTLKWNLRQVLFRLIFIHVYEEYSKLGFDHKEKLGFLQRLSTTTNQILARRVLHP